MADSWHGGKGSRPRPVQVDRQTFEDNWDKIFGKTEAAHHQQPRSDDDTENDNSERDV